MTRNKTECSSVCNDESKIFENHNTENKFIHERKSKKKVSFSESEDEHIPYDKYSERSWELSNNSDLQTFSETQFYNAEVKSSEFREKLEVDKNDVKDFNVETKNILTTNNKYKNTITSLLKESKDITDIKESSQSNNDYGEHL